MRVHREMAALDHDGVIELWQAADEQTAAEPTHVDTVGARPRVDDVGTRERELTSTGARVSYSP